DFQDKTVGLIKVEAEPIFAKEYAFNELSKALSLLRFFHCASKNPDCTCFTVPSGYSIIHARYSLMLINEMITNTKADYALTYKPWLICCSDIQNFKSNGLDILHDLINIKRNEFQDNLLNSLMLFSKCSILSDYSEKLTAIFVALESLLLKNENGQIQATISERIAFTISDNKEERKEIVQLIKGIYSLRSKFLHHGKKFDDVEKFKKFMLKIWKFFQTLIQSERSKKFQSNDAFFHWIDDKKFS
ncbi:MAG: hypothetical protein GX121_10740, partial [Ignavibacteria bacterium]|nr:hypothetical protein [Ignavibacteria bacterium]